LRLPEDIPRIINVLRSFNKLKTKLPHKDINKYTFRDLEAQVDKLSGTAIKSKRQKAKDIKAEGVEDYRENASWKIIKVTTAKAACILSKNTKWCTSDEGVAAGYLPLYIVFKKSGSKLIKVAQYDADFDQVMDVKDNPIDQVPKSLAELMKPQSPSPEQAYRYAKDVIKGRWPDGEETIKKDPKWAYHYALDVIKGRWPEAEETIKNDPEWAYHYALDVIKGRWPE